MWPNNSNGSNGSRVVRFSAVFLLARLSVFSHDIAKTDAGWITERDTEMFHRESRKFIYVGSKVKRSRPRGTKTLLVWVFALL